MTTSKSQIFKILILDPKKDNHSIMPQEQLKCTSYLLFSQRRFSYLGFVYILLVKMDFFFFFFFGCFVQKGLLITIMDLIILIFEFCGLTLNFEAHFFFLDGVMYDFFFFFNKSFKFKQISICQLIFFQWARPQIKRTQNRIVQNSRSPKHPKISMRKGLQFLL